METYTFLKDRQDNKWCSPKKIWFFKHKKKVGQGVYIILLSYYGGASFGKCGSGQATQGPKSTGASFYLCQFTSHQKDCMLLTLTKIASLLVLLLLLFFKFH